MLSNTRRTPVSSPGPGVIPDGTNGPVSQEPPAAVPNTPRAREAAAAANRPEASAEHFRGKTKHRAGARGVAAPASMEFLSFEDNGGAFHWAIVAASGDRLVQSATFTSYEEAKQAAGVVRSGAVSAPFEKRADDPAPLRLAPRRETAKVTDDLDAERWLDEGGSFSSDALTRCPVRR